jgi:hypothetical protein
MSLPQANGVTDYGWCAFIVKYSASGFAQWYSRVEQVFANDGVAASRNTCFNQIFTDSNDQLYFLSQMDRVTVTAYNSDGSASPLALPYSAGKATVVLKYSSSGFAQTIACVGETGQLVASAVADASGTVYLQVTYLVPIVLDDNGATTSTLLSDITYDGTYRMSLIKYALH